MSRVFSSLLIVSLLAGGALALPSHSWQLVQAGATILDTGGSPEPGTYSTWDLMVTTGTNWAAAQMIAHSDEPGAIYHHAGGGNTAPQDFIVGLYPDAAYDTYVTAPPGAYPDNVGTQPPADLAAALAVSAPNIVMNSQDMVIGWAVSSGEALYGPGTHMIARITTRDADGQPGVPGYAGQWDLMLWETGSGETRTGVLSGVGPIFAPEPATMMVLGLGALASLLRRHR